MPMVVPVTPVGILMPFGFLPYIRYVPKHGVERSARLTTKTWSWVQPV